ncbi:MAG TPA: asparagine synthetase B, partial [Bacteroidia bacterium]|nr:asparagine synthetase B [Bacteroidia bacterium]
MKKLILVLLLSAAFARVQAAFILIPMDDTQKNHLKAYGIAYYALQNTVDVQWLLNYKGGSFLLSDIRKLEEECTIRGVSFQVIADVQATAILQEIADPEVNMEIMKLEKAPKIAVYSPKNKMPWDDAVTMVLKY